MKLTKIMRAHPFILTICGLGLLSLAGCSAGVPVDLARTVLLQEIPVTDGVAQAGFLACVAIDSRDADAKTLRLLREARIDAVAASECQWVMGSSGTFHRASGRKALLVDVHGYKRQGTVQYEARHHGKFATMKTLEVARSSDGWKIVRTLEFMMAAWVRLQGRYS